MKQDAIDTLADEKTYLCDDSMARWKRHNGEWQIQMNVDADVGDTITDIKVIDRFNRIKLVEFATVVRKTWKYDYLVPESSLAAT